MDLMEELARAIRHRNNLLRFWGGRWDNLPAEAKQMLIKAAQDTEDLRERIRSH